MVDWGGVEVATSICPREEYFCTKSKLERLFGSHKCENWALKRRECEAFHLSQKKKENRKSEQSHGTYGYRFVCIFGLTVWNANCD